MRPACCRSSVRFRTRPSTCLCLLTDETGLIQQQRDLIPELCRRTGRASRLIRKSTPRSKKRTPAYLARGRAQTAPTRTYICFLKSTLTRRFIGTSVKQQPIPCGESRAKPCPHAWAPVVLGFSKQYCILSLEPAHTRSHYFDRGSACGVEARSCGEEQWRHRGRRRVSIAHLHWNTVVGPSHQCKFFVCTLPLDLGHLW